MVDTRDRIRNHIQDTPGVHFRGLERDLDLATGQIQHHLHRLITADDIVSREIVGKTHYFDLTFEPWEQRTLAFLRRESAREIIVRLHANGPTKPATLATELELARSTVSWHVSHLVKHDIIEKSDEYPIRLTLAHPNRTACLLNEVSPSLPDTIVDRFIQTVDHLFE